jgi:RNA polymerase sigma-70 factor (sigma-E family)
MAGGSDGRASYTAYVDARWAALYRVAHLLTMDATEAEDLLQATLVKAYVKWERVSAATSVDAYVRRMMVNELLGEQRLRARRRGKAHLLPVVDAEATDDPIDRLDLWDHLSELPPRQRAVLVLRYYEDLSEAETAELLGCSRGTVKSQSHDALKALRGRLDTGEEVPQ